jgi:predicted nucleic acid-binding protein
VRITIDIPDDLAVQYLPAGKDAAQAVMEDALVQAYREERISARQLMEALGIPTRYELDGAIVIPNAVVGELSRPQTPSKVREWMSALPRWAKVVLPQSFDLPFPDLGLGEREAISIARTSSAHILLTDDRGARESAATLGIQTVLTVRVLSTASDLGLVDFTGALRRLQQTNFRISNKVIESLMRRRPLE